MRKREESLDTGLIKSQQATGKSARGWLIDWLEGINPRVSALAMSLALWVAIIASLRLLIA